MPRVSVPVSPDELRRLHELAEAERRSLASLMRYIVKLLLDRQPLGARDAEQ